MIYSATHAVAAACDKLSIKYTMEEHNDTSYVTFQTQLDCGSSVRFFFLSSDEGNDVRLRVYPSIRLCNENAEKRVAMLEAVNDANNTYRFAKFTIDKDGDVNCQMDFPACIEDVSAVATEYIIRSMQIIDDVYPI